NSLASIGGYLLIVQNPQLQNLNGLSTLTSIGGELHIELNSQLTDISGIQNINPASIGGVSGLNIIDNATLSVCNLPNICAYLAIPPGTHSRSISGNAGFCLNTATVVA